MSRITVGLVVAGLSSQALAQVPCETPRIRDVAPLAGAIAQDKAMAQTFLKASQACQMAQSDACDAARLECNNQLASTLKGQVGFDDGAWLRDMLLPYGGLSYPPTRQFQPGTAAMDTSCNGDTNQLMSASTRRSFQATRRQAILDEYPRYTQWVQDQAKACRDRAAIEEQRRAQERAEAERLAAAALAAKMTEEQRQKAEAEARRKAEQEAKARAEAQKEAERKAKEAQEKAERERMTAAERAAAEKADAERKAKEEREAAEERAKEEREKAEERAKEEREKAEKLAKEEKEAAKEEAQKERERAEKKAEEEREKAERAQRDAKDEREAAERKAKQEAERAKEEAERKARDAAEAAAVKAREDRKLALRTQKEKLTLQADEAERRAAEIAGMSFTAEQSQQAAQLNTERVQALERAKTLRAQALEIIIDDADERSRGSVGILGGGGATNWPGATSAALGGELLFHLGFWGTAPSEGLASGFELRALSRFLTTIGTNSVQQLEALVTARYFFGRFGIGGAVEFRWNQPVVANISNVNVGFGPTLGFAFVDQPRTRVMLSASWLPLTQQGFQNPFRTVGNLEVSHDFFVANISGGMQTQAVPVSPQAPNGGTILGWYVGAFAGVRLRW